MEQNILNEEHVFARLVICPGLFEQLGPIQHGQIVFWLRRSSFVKEQDMETVLTSMAFLLNLNWK